MKEKLRKNINPMADNYKKNFDEKQISSKNFNETLKFTFLLVN